MVDCDLRQIRFPNWSISLPKRRGYRDEHEQNRQQDDSHRTPLIICRDRSGESTPAVKPNFPERRRFRRGSRLLAPTRFKLKEIVTKALRLQAPYYLSLHAT